jgi:hypothetical protein
MKRFIMCMLTVSLLGLTVLAQEPPKAYETHPGYVDFGSFERFQSSPKTVEVSIKGPLLKFVSKATAQEDPEFSQLLDGLLLIQVNVFEVVEQQVTDVTDIIQNTSNALAGKHWERMARVQDGEQHIEVYTQFGETGFMTGLVVMALGENNEAVFVNIVGTLDPEQLGKLSSKFNIPKISELDLSGNE